MDICTNLSNKSFKILLAVSFFWFVSILMVFLNKYLLNSKELKFDAPMFVTWYQCLFSVFIYFIWYLGSHLFPKIIKFFQFKISFQTSIEIIPLTLAFISMIIFNNLSLKYVPVSFYMIAKSLATFFNLLLIYIYFGEKTSYKAFICCMLITIGFFLGVRQEKSISNLSEFGVVYGILSAFFSALTGVYIKKTIKLLDGDLWKLNFYNNLYASLAIIPIIFYQNELEKIIQFEGITSFYFWIILSLTGFLGFLCGYATSLQIQLTSPLTHNISGTTKSCLQTVLGVVYFLETKTFLWWLSNLFILVGAFLYSVVRNNEMNVKKKQVNLNENEA